MTSPFDLKDLEARVLADGLPAAEKIAEVAATAVLGWLSESLELEAVKQPLFAIAVPVLAALTPIIMDEIKKISPTPAA